MASFRYQVRISDGRLQNGIVEAPTIEAAREALDERGYDVLMLEPYEGVEAATKSLVAFLNRVSAKELVASVRMMAVMISASVSITDAVRNIGKQTENPKFRAMLMDIAGDVEGGGKLSDAMEKYPKTFSQFFTNMIRSGETTGQLSEVLNYLADQQEKDYDLFSKIKGALTYPIVIVAGMSVAAVVMMTFVVPKLTQVLTESGAELPLATKILIGTSDIMVNFWWLILLSLFIFVSVFIFWKKTEYGSYAWDSFKMRIPVMGMILREMYVVRFCRSMNTLMKGGLTMVQALEIAASVIGNQAWKAMILEVIQGVNDGAPMAQVMKQHKFVPPLVVQMLAVGEDTGKLNEVLGRLSDFYSRNVANISANVLTLIEPLVMVVLGLGVGVMVAAIMMPLYNLSSSV
ncbi:type II secretion system F family protein [Patescibacteria group bacterium]|nr:type II secretion system F family protein [Patescibacteria group bacterium]